MIQRSNHVKSLDWHPTRKILAIGWENGEVVIWNENDHELHETSTNHKTAVNIVAWNPSGSRLATADVVCIAGYINFMILESKCL